MHRDRVLALSVRSDQLILKSVELTRDSDRIREHAQVLRQKVRDLHRDWEGAVKKTA